MAISSIRKSVAVCVLSLGIFSAPSVYAETLTDAFISAYKNSNLLEQRRALLRAADEDVVQARATLLPVINFVANANFRTRAIGAGGTRVENWALAASLNAQLTIYDNGVSRFATDAAKETVLGLRGALLQVEQQVLVNTVQAYMEVIRAAQTVSLRQSNVRLITQELRAARDRFEVGEVTRTDVAIAEARLAASRGNLAAAHGDMEIARETYLAVVGHYPGNLNWPKSPPLTARTEDAAKAVAVRTHPSIEEAQRNVNAAEALIQRARAAMGPSVNTNASIVTTGELITTFNAGVALNVPIYSGGTLRSAMRKSMAQRDASRALLLQSVVDVKQNVGIRWASLAVAAARTEASRRQVRASQVAYDGVREEAKFGSRTTLDVLNAEQELLDARSSLISAEVDQYNSVYGLLSAMGLLTSDQLALGIVTYDPIEYYKYATTNDPLHRMSPQGLQLDRLFRRLGRDKP